MNICLSAPHRLLIAIDIDRIMSITIIITITTESEGRWWAKEA